MLIVIDSDKRIVDNKVLSCFKGFLLLAVNSSPEYSRILKESDELLCKYPFISKLIDRDRIEEPMELSIEKAKILSQFLALDSDREDYERVQLYLMGCRHILEVFQLLGIFK